jgi:signal transduction histidine kinase
MHELDDETTDPGETEPVGPQSSLAARLRQGPMHALTALHLGLVQLADPDRGRTAPGLADRLESLRSQTEWIIDELDRIIRDLSEAGLIDLRDTPSATLYARLRQLCSDLETESGVTCGFRVQAEHTNLSSLASEVLYRSIRELLTNALKHAHATRVDVTSEATPDGARVFSVTDDGIGLLTPTRRSAQFVRSHFGLWNLDLCLGEIGGYMEIDSDSGVSVRIVLPPHLAEH